MLIFYVLPPVSFVIFFLLKTVSFPELFGSVFPSRHSVHMVGMEILILIAFALGPERSEKGHFCFEMSVKLCMSWGKCNENFLFDATRKEQNSILN